MTLTPEIRESLKNDFEKMLASLELVDHGEVNLKLVVHDNRLVNVEGSTTRRRKVDTGVRK